MTPEVQAVLEHLDQHEPAAPKPKKTRSDAGKPRVKPAPVPTSGTLTAAQRQELERLRIIFHGSLLTANRAEANYFAYLDSITSA